MTPADWARVRELFEAALAEAPPDLPDWVARHTSDGEVRRQVLSLLDCDRRAGSFLEQPIAELVPDLLAEDDALTPGSVVGSYTIVRELGRGGMGRVYLASDGRLGRQVALKALPPRLTRDPAQRARLQREAQAAAVLSHPGICTVFALEELNGELFIASEFVDGRTLREEIAGGGRPSRDAIVRTALELASALASAHTAGITHRDLKPENIMRTSDGRVKILDFGLARVDAAVRLPTPALATAPHTIVGTPAYMAPEQLTARPVDARTDLFAFGVLMYEYSCGTHPFAADTELATLARVLESGARPLAERSANVPPRVADVIERCLSKEPGGRPASAAEIVAAIERSDGDAKPSLMIWWRSHQLIAMALYIVASTVAWAIKETRPGSLTLWVFVAIGVVSAVAGTMRGHLVFTSAMNLPSLVSEWRRVARALRVCDVLLAAALFADGLTLAPVTPLWAVMAMLLALIIVLAALLMEPATNAAALRA